MSTSQIIITLFSICVFYVVIIWFLHKASVYFHKMDQKVGNTDRIEMGCSCNENFENDTSPINNDASGFLAKEKPDAK